MGAYRLKAKFIVGLSIALLASAPLAVQADAQTPAVASAAPTGGPDQSYILGPDDVVQVEVLGRDDFKIQARITQQGTIQLRYIGAVPAANRTTTQLAQDVTNALQAGGYFAHPVVSVDIISYASRYVTVLGQVDHPGLVPIDRNYRVSEVLAKVGGVAADGAVYVILRPMSGAERQLTVKDLATGDLNEDPYVSPGDKIYVPKAEVFYISGQVKAPGAYPIISDMTLLMAISKGGGVTDLGSTGKAKVTRGGKTIHVKLDDKIEPGDVINIGERLF